MEGVGARDVALKLFVQLLGLFSFRRSRGPCRGSRAERHREKRSLGPGGAAVGGGEEEEEKEEEKAAVQTRLSEAGLGGRVRRLCAQTVLQPRARPRPWPGPRLREEEEPAWAPRRAGRPAARAGEERRAAPAPAGPPKP